MARYIDADALCTYFKILYEHAQTNGMYNHAKLYDRAFQAVADAPTAEVVPKSEVERLQEALSKAEADVKNYMKVAEYQQNLSVKRYHEIKRLNEDVERLQEEIETFKDTNEHLAVLLEEAKQAYANYEETTGLKQAKQEVACEIIGIIDKRMELKIEQCKGIHNEIVLGVYRGQLDAYRDIKEIIKQKYTEEKT